MPVSLPGNLMVSVSGFRGKVGSCLTPELIASLAAAFGAFLENEGSPGPVYLARDSRTSGGMFSDAARAGLVSAGSDVVDLGVVPTPTVLLAVKDAGAAGALVVTASHNPAEWNALKFVGPNGTFLDVDWMTRFRCFLSEEVVLRSEWNRLGSVRRDPGAIQRHIRRILELPLLEVDRIRERGFRVALDCVRGAGGLMVPQLLEALGCTVSGMDLKPDGYFPRDPEPTAMNLGGLGSLVRESGSELGFAVDPDVDRLSLVDGEGEPLGEDLTLALCTAMVLQRRKGPVVMNFSTSRVVADVVRDYGSRLIRAPVGEVNVSQMMSQEGAVIGGEGNGGVILPDLHLTRDASLSCALILQHLLDEGIGLRGSADRWPNYTIVKEKARFPREKIEDAYVALSEGLPPAEATTEDGLHLDWPLRGEWLHLRPSGTEPVVRLIAEARSEARAHEIVAQVRDLLVLLETS